LENNVFESTRSWDGTPQPYALNVANWLSVATSYTFRNNTLGSDILIQPRVNGFSVTGNTGDVTSCTAGVTYAHNVFESKRCGSTDRQSSAVSSQYVNPAAHDWHLKAGAPAI